MSHVRIVNAVFNSPWAIHRPWLGSLFSILHTRIGEPTQVALELGDVAAVESRLRHGSGSSRFFANRWGIAHGSLVNHSTRIHAEAARRCGGSYDTYQSVVESEEAKLPSGQIAHIFGSGVIGKHLSSMEELCAGGLSLDRIQTALKAARDDEKIGAIVLHLDTPGGMCYGCTETAALVEKIRAEKTVVDFTDSLKASAGYWIASRTGASYVTPSADVGSIGVYCAYVDYTEWFKKQGMSTTLIADGKHKGAGYPGTTLTEEQLEKIKADVLACGAMFRADVRAGRGGKVSDDTMQGQCFTGQSAVDVGLADAVVPDLEACLADVAQSL